MLPLRWATAKIRHHRAPSCVRVYWSIDDLHDLRRFRQFDLRFGTLLSLRICPNLSVQGIHPMSFLARRPPPAIRILLFAERHCQES
jgi:hypothetical protein